MNEHMNDDWIHMVNKPNKSAEWIDYESPTSKHRIFSKIKDFPKKLIIALSLTGAMAACDRPDITPPTIEISSEASNGITITKPETFRSSGDKVYLGNTLVATFTDESWIRTISLFEDGRSVPSWTIINETCSLWANATDNSENRNVSTTKTINVKYENNEKPECNFYESKIEGVFQWDKISLSGKEVYVWEKKAFAWNNDDYILSIKLGDKDITNNLPFSLQDIGNFDLTCTLTNSKNGKSDNRTTKVTVNEVDNNQAPEITRVYQWTPNILWWVVAKKWENNQLLFWDVVIYDWKDDDTPVCTQSLKLKWSDEEKIWKEINTPGMYVFALIDGKWKSTYVEFPVVCNSVDLTNLKDLNMQVEEEVDLFQWMTVPNWIQISKVEVEINWQRTEIKENNGHYLYTPSQPWICYIYVTEKWEFGNTYVEKSKNPLTIKDAEYPEFQSITINNINPVDVFPQIAQIEAWDPNIYEYVKDLWVAEIYVMRSMMVDYGTGDYTPEEYKRLSSRITIGSRSEISDDYQEYGRIWPIVNDPYISDHGRCTFQNLTNLKWDYTNIKNLSDLWEGRAKNLSEYAKAHPNEIFIFYSSTSPQYYTQDEYKQEIFQQNIVDLCNLPNVIIFMSWGDTKNINWVPIKKVYNGVYQSNWDWMYNNSSMVNSDQNNYPHSNMRVVIWTDSKWNADMTNSQGSVFPEGSNNGSIVSGRPILPFYQRKNGIKWKLFGQDLPKNWSYTTSNTAPTIASETQLMFGLRPDVKDANELLQMIESCTADPDYISLNWERQALQKYSPANFARKYCLMMDIPSSIKMGEIVRLTKWRYKWIVIDIPWAVVEINWEWVPYNKENEPLIKSQNPMYLELWIDTNEAMKYWNKNLKWKLRAVDDQRNGLTNIEKEITININ